MNFMFNVYERCSTRTVAGLSEKVAAAIAKDAVALADAPTAMKARSRKQKPMNIVLFVSLPGMYCRKLSHTHTQTHYIHTDTKARLKAKVRND